MDELGTGAFAKKYWPDHIAAMRTMTCQLALSGHIHARVADQSGPRDHNGKLLYRSNCVVVEDSEDNRKIVQQYLETRVKPDRISPALRSMYHRSGANKTTALKTKKKKVGLSSNGLSSLPIGELAILLERAQREERRIKREMLKRLS